MAPIFQTSNLERAVTRRMAALPAAPLDPAFIARLQAAVHHEALRYRAATPGLRRWRWAIAIAAAAVLMVAARMERSLAPPENTTALADAEQQLDVWSDAFATLVTETEVTAPLRLDEESLDRVVDSINAGLSLGS